jgi:alkanesulfonate monooxygenase SsuD/methylene tetrahydromethanopterin reductase-like flavin-dependent oxidoreductase (luciferase family)
MVVRTTDRRAAAADMISRLGTAMTVDEALATPYLLIGTPEQMADQLLASRERYGFSYVTVHEPFREAFEPVVERLRS